MVMLDVSTSMKVQDIKRGAESYSRLESAKSLVSRLITEQANNRYGLGIFAGEAQGVSPITSDHNVFLTFLDGVDDKNLQTQWTDLLAALRLGTDRFDPEDESAKVLLIISDGGDEKIKEKLSSNKETLKENKILPLMIGVGTKKGWPIPLGKDPFGSPIYRQFEWKTVTSSYFPWALQQLAKELDGYYSHIESVKDLTKVYKTINSLEKKAIEQSSTEKRSLVRALTWLILLLFIVYLLISLKIIKYGENKRTDTNTL